jgi:hypothetical protein
MHVVAAVNVFYAKAWLAKEREKNQTKPIKTHLFRIPYTIKNLFPKKKIPLKIVLQ